MSVYVGRRLPRVENQLNLDGGFSLYSDLVTLVTALALGNAAGTNKINLALADD